MFIYGQSPICIRDSTKPAHAALVLHRAGYLQVSPCNVHTHAHSLVFVLLQAPVPSGGHLHPLLKVRTQFRKIFTQMGFEEMPTNNYVESSFWNFDALFQPQQVRASVCVFC